MAGSQDEVLEGFEGGFLYVAMVTEESSMISIDVMVLPISARCSLGLFVHIEVFGMDQCSHEERHLNDVK